MSVLSIFGLILNCPLVVLLIFVCWFCFIFIGEGWMRWENFDIQDISFLSWFASLQLYLCYFLWPSIFFCISYFLSHLIRCEFIHFDDKNVDWYSAEYCIKNSFNLCFELFEIFFQKKKNVYFYAFLLKRLNNMLIKNKKFLFKYLVAPCSCICHSHT